MLRRFVVVALALSLLCVPTAVFLLTNHNQSQRKVQLRGSSTQPVEESLPTTSRKPLLVLWVIEPEIVLEWNFMLHGPFGDLDRPIMHRKADKDFECTSDMMLVTFPWAGRDTTRNDQFWKAIHDCIKKAKATNVGVMDIGDEQGDAKAWYYEPFTYVFRHYYFPKIVSDKVHWIPNGYTTNAGPRSTGVLPPTSMRTTFCAFSGSKQRGRSANDRKELQDAAKQGVTMKLCNVKITDGFNRGLSKFDYTAVLQNTIFALCPEGNSPETLRLYEAMENGAIPVVKAGSLAMEGPFKSAPFVFVDHWKDFDKVLMSHMADEWGRTDKQQAEVIRWWKGLKRDTAALVRRSIDAGFEARYGPGA